MVATINFNPIQTTNVQGSFGISSDGYIQGCAMDDYSVRNFLAAGLVATTEDLPMWGGVPIVEYIPTSANTAQGGTIKRAVPSNTISGFSVYDQGYNAIQSAQSPAPVYLPGQSVNFYRTNSGARIAVPIDPAFAAALVAGTISQAASWDYESSQLTAYNAYVGQKTITSITWSGGVATVTTSTSHGYTTGISVVIENAVPDEYNGEYVITVTGATTFTYVLADDPGSETTPGDVKALGGAIPCRILNVNVGNSKVLVWDADELTATWNTSGSCALILI